MPSQLKPCPFCGSRGMIAATLDDMYRPLCERDGCCALDGEIARGEAITAWNTRDPDTDLLHRIAEAMKERAANICQTIAKIEDAKGIDEAFIAADDVREARDAILAIKAQFEGGEV